MVNIPNFRVWYEGKLWLLAKLDLWGDPDQTTCDLAPYLPKYSEKFNIPLAEVKLMQSTGLKDKNGVEIYESDILKAYPNNTIYIGKVYYEDGQWFGACDYLDYAVAYSGAEVIGNIYENPELLETKKD